MKIREVKGEVSYQLTLSLEEAKIILSLCRSIGGDPDTTKARPLLNEITGALQTLRVPCEDKYFNGRLTAIL